jgi:hypothetical protein
MTVVVVSGAVANKPLNGGAAWTRLSWALGLERLGFDVWFIEQIASKVCCDDFGRPAPFHESVNVRYFDEVMAFAGLTNRAALLCDGDEVHGVAAPELLQAAEAADLLVNISGHLRLGELLRRFDRRAFIDLDPGFTQVWASAGHEETGLAGHHLYFTVGTRIGTAACGIPTADVSWIPVRQPVVLDLWPTATRDGLDRFTTVASWRGPFGPVECAGKTYGLKLHEFRRIIDLPRHIEQRFELALDIDESDDGDRRSLQAAGWQVVDARSVAASPEAFRDYVTSSGAEFSTAQGVYVETKSGWFSDRTTRYLASGKPALVQDTGFSQELPVGEGLLCFRTLDEAAAAAASIAGDYERHARTAREIAEALFDSDVVLADFVERAGVAP